MNQISLASMMMHLNMNKATKPDEGMVRHMILNSLRMYRTKFKVEFGELVLCYDSKHYWRRDHFSCLNDIKQELKDYFPYKHLEVYGAEADDIIAALCGELEFDNGKTLILSGDKDFIQLHRFSNVSQYSPITKKFVNGHDPKAYLAEHILKGDASDGIPNVLSPDHTFVEGLRQRPLGKKKMAQWNNVLDYEFNIERLPNDEVKRNYQRNQQLIDLNNTPSELYIVCIRAYQDAPEGDRSKLLNYFIEKRLNNLTDSIGEF